MKFYLQANVFELELNRFERRKLLGNVADSRLEDEWRSHLSFIPLFNIRYYN
uniref:Uncharacterized protein n=1 Tax=Ascaris lumbricoides TaxID=6252 RepID=A0A0M3HGX6_ASCLU